MNSRARRDATVTTGAASVLAFVALLIPQVAGALNLTTLGKVLVAVGLGILTACGQRLINRRTSRRAVQDALRVWPPEPLDGGRLSTLGVFPTQDAHGRRARYQPRPAGEDAMLRDALRASRIVIVHGSPRCGKSRAVSEAAAQELPDVPAVIPLDSESLGSLLDGEMDLPLSQPELCLWLDGLDRFTDALDPCSVATVQAASNPGARIVATIRTDEWTQLVAGTGQESQAARALADAATIVELGPFTPAPADAVDPPASRPAMRPRPLVRDTPFVLLLSALLAVIVGGVILETRGEVLSPPSISDQMDTLTSELVAGAGPGGGRVVDDERVQFHSTDQPSWLLVVQDLPTAAMFNEGAAEGGFPRPRSDDLRIYDVVGDRLRLELNFRPAGVGATAAQWNDFQAGAPPSADYAEDGSDDVIAGYSLPSQATDALLPFAIRWQDGRYTLTPLTPDEPDLGTRGLTRATVTYRRQAYETRLTLRNAVTDPRFRDLSVAGYRVQTFALAQSPYRLLTGYFTAYPHSGETQVMEIHASQIRPGLVVLPCQPSYSACPAPRDEQEVIVPPDKALDNGLLEGWQMVGSRWTTPVRVVQRGPG